jgi:hypothetical protein
MPLYGTANMEQCQGTKPAQAHVSHNTSNLGNDATAAVQPGRMQIQNLTGRLRAAFFLEGGRRGAGLDTPYPSPMAKRISATQPVYQN